MLAGGWDRWGGRWWTIAWLRHQTTGYEDLQIARVNGLRREVRRELAQRSCDLLVRSRRCDVVDAALCPIRRALVRSIAIGAEA